MLPKPSDYTMMPVQRMLEEGLRNFKLQLEQQAKKASQEIAGRIHMIEQELEAANELLESQNTHYLGAYEEHFEKPDELTREILHLSKRAYDSTYELINSLRRVLRKEIDNFRKAKVHEEKIVSLNQEIDKLASFELSAEIIPMTKKEFIYE